MVLAQPVRFADMYKKMDNPNKVAKWLGLQKHPFYAALAKKEAEGEVVNWLQAVVSIIYSMAPEDRYWRNAASKRVQKLARAARASTLKKARAEIIGKRPFSEAVARTSAVQDHLREVLVPDEFYSLPRSLAVFHGLTDALGPLRRQLGPPVRARRVLTADVHETAVVPRSDADDRIFFQMIRTRPAKGKHVYGSPATSSAPSAER